MYTPREEWGQVRRHLTGVGYVCYDEERGYTSAGGAACTAEVLDSFEPRAQHIGQLEILAELVPYLTEPATFRGREVVHFVDNTSAIYATIKGYSPSRDSARLVHLIHSVLAALGTTVWFEYVPSKLNIADAPSRGDFDLLVGLGARFYSPVFPTLEQVEAPEGAWLTMHYRKSTHSRRSAARRLRSRAGGAL
jgi:hypothetical protein